MSDLGDWRGETKIFSVEEFVDHLSRLGAAYARLEAEVRGALELKEPHILNLVGELPVHKTKVYSSRKLNSIRRIILHHSAGLVSASPTAIALYHVNGRDWPGIGYHFYITANGTIFQVNSLETISWHAGGNNEDSIGICLAGTFLGVDPPGEQLSAARMLVQWLMWKLDIREEDVIGHKEAYPAGSGGTACPGDTWEKWRAVILGAKPQGVGGSGE